MWNSRWHANHLITSGKFVDKHFCRCWWTTFRAWRHVYILWSGDMPWEVEKIYFFKKIEINLSKYIKFSKMTKMSIDGADSRYASRDPRSRGAPTDLPGRKWHSWNTSLIKIHLQSLVWDCKIKVIQAKTLSCDKWSLFKERNNNQVRSLFFKTLGHESRPLASSDA